MSTLSRGWRHSPWYRLWPEGVLTTPYLKTFGYSLRVRRSDTLNTCRERPRNTFVNTRPCNWLLTTSSCHPLESPCEVLVTIVRLFGKVVTWPSSSVRGTLWTGKGPNLGLRSNLPSSRWTHRQTWEFYWENPKPRWPQSVWTWDSEGVSLKSHTYPRRKNNTPLYSSNGR